MKKIRKILALIALVFVIVIAGDIIYSAGRETGRTETVQMVNELASNYTFSIKDNDGWQLGSSRGGEFFPDYTASLEHDYDWDDCKISLWYERK